MAERRRVVVTGMGMLSAVGNDVRTTWDALLAGQTGVRPIRQENKLLIPAAFSPVR